MKISKRTLAVVLSLVLAMSVTAFGTIAYMTDQETVTNTFTIGKVDIIVDEDNVDNTLGPDTDGDGVPDIPLRDTKNEYKLVPGASYVKDPTVTVLEGSEECYVRMRIELNCYAKLKAIAEREGLSTEYTALLTQFVTIDNANWQFVKTGYKDIDTMTFEYWYKPTNGEFETIDAANSNVKLPKLFGTFSVPTYFVAGDLVDLQDLTMDVYGDAIQTADTFENAKAAWDAFDKQNGLTTSGAAGEGEAATEQDVPTDEDAGEDDTEETTEP